MTVTEEFHALLNGPEDAVGLAHAALLVAAHRYPDLDLDTELRRLDGLAHDCAPTLHSIRSHLYDKLGFTGNRADYYDPRNSFLNDVLDRRTGLPITLAIVVIEVGQRAGIAIDPIGMPGHFLVGAQRAYFDPFEGQILDGAAACAIRYEALGTGTPFRPDFLAPVGPRAVVSRLLANLQAVFFSTDLTAAAWVVGLRLAVPGLSVVERRGLAQALASLGRFDAAADELLRLRADLPDVAGQLEIEARRLRSRTN